MELYRVVFEVQYDGAEWITDSYSFGGRGFRLETAIVIVNDLEQYGLDGAKVRNVRIVKM